MERLPKLRVKSEECKVVGWFPHHYNCHTERSGYNKPRSRKHLFLLKTANLN